MRGEIGIFRFGKIYVQTARRVEERTAGEREPPPPLRARPLVENCGWGEKDARVAYTQAVGVYSPFARLIFFLCAR